MSKPIFIHIPKNGGTTVKQVFHKRAFCHHHTRLQDLHAYDGEIEDAYKFAFIRNPYDRAVSYYRFVVRRYSERDLPKTWKLPHVHDSFLDFLRYAIPNWEVFKPQVFWTEGVEFNYLGRFENFEQDLRAIGKEVNIKLGKIPVTNASKRHTDYRNYYCEESRGMVEEFFKEDFETFGYEYE